MYWGLGLKLSPVIASFVAVTIFNQASFGAEPSSAVVGPNGSFLIHTFVECNGLPQTNFSYRSTNGTLQFVRSTRNMCSNRDQPVIEVRYTARTNAGQDQVVISNFGRPVAVVNVAIHPNVRLPAWEKSVNAELGKSSTLQRFFNCSGPPPVINATPSSGTVQFVQTTENCSGRSVVAYDLVYQPKALGRSEIVFKTNFAPPFKYTVDVTAGATAQMAPNVSEKAGSKAEPALAAKTDAEWYKKLCAHFTPPSNAIELQDITLQHAKCVIDPEKLDYALVCTYNDQSQNFFYIFKGAAVSDFRQQITIPYYPPKSTILAVLDNGKAVFVEEKELSLEFGGYLGTVTVSRGTLDFKTYYKNVAQLRGDGRCSKSNDIEAMLSNNAKVIRQQAVKKAEDAAQSERDRINREEELKKRKI